MAEQETLDPNQYYILTQPYNHPINPEICFEPQNHQDAMSKLVEAFEKLRISNVALNNSSHNIGRTTLDNLPQEILLNITKKFAEPWVMTNDLADWTVYSLDRESRERQRTLVSLCKTSRLLSATATTVLYHCAHLATTKSVRFFLHTLRTRPGLANLVKQVSCPHQVLMRLAYLFSHDTFDHDIGRLLSGGWVNERSMGLILDEGNIIRYHDLVEILHYIPRVRTLSVPQSELGLVSNLWGGYLWLEYLTKLSISLHFQPSSRLGENDPYRVLSWLHPVTIATTCPALQYMELISPFRIWKAEFTDVSSEMPIKKEYFYLPGKYIVSLSSISLGGGGGVQWDLMTLQQPVFHPSCCHTLHFDGPNSKNKQRLFIAQQRQWNLNHFLNTRGQGIRVLNLDWDTECCLFDTVDLFGPVGWITTLKGLTNLTHLTISLQVLFFRLPFFAREVDQMGQDPATEINRLFPSSLKVLRIDEWMPNLFWPAESPQTIHAAKVTTFSTAVGFFMTWLRRYWLHNRRDRELWFKRYGQLDEYAESLRRTRGGPRVSGRRYFSSVIPGEDRYVRTKFVKVLRWGDLMHPQS